jgi:hypothetical protein
MILTNYFVLAAPGSGKTFQFKDFANYVDVDDILTFPKTDEWWNDDAAKQKFELSAKFQLLNDSHSGKIKDKVLFLGSTYSLGNVIDVLVVIPDATHLKNLGDRKHRLGIKDWPRLRNNKRRFSAIYHDRIVTSFEEVPGFLRNLQRLNQPKEASKFGNIETQPNEVASLFARLRHKNFKFGLQTHVFKGASDKIMTICKEWVGCESLPGLALEARSKGKKVVHACPVLLARLLQPDFALIDPLWGVSTDTDAYITMGCGMRPAMSVVNLAYIVAIKRGMAVIKLPLAYDVRRFSALRSMKIKVSILEFARVKFAICSIKNQKIGKPLTLVTNPLDFGARKETPDERKESPIAVYRKAVQDYKMKWLTELAKSGSRKVLDVGTGSGGSVFLYAKNGIDVVFVEPDKEQFKALTRRTAEALVEYPDWKVKLLNERFSGPVADRVTVSFFSLPLTEWVIPGSDGPGKPLTGEYLVIGTSRLQIDKLLNGWGTHVDDFFSVRAEKDRVHVKIPGLIDVTERPLQTRGRNLCNVLSLPVGQDTLASIYAVYVSPSIGEMIR